MPSCRRPATASASRWNRARSCGPACVRDPGELDKLPADERKEYLALWADLAAVLARPEK